MQKQTQERYINAEVTVMPSFPDRLLLKRTDGSYLCIRVERFISLIVRGGEFK